VTEVATNEDDELLSKIGSTLLAVQWTERILKATLPVAYLAEPMTASSLDADEMALEKKPLGALARALRARADVRPEFDELLAEFVRERNVLAHHFEMRFALATIEGRRSAHAFCEKLQHLAQTIAESLSDALRVRLSDVFMQLAIDVPPAEFPKVRTYEDAKKAVLTIQEYVRATERS
jgi:hypothetical protein